MNIREITPQRRVNPTKSEKGKNYSKHKPDLQEDFNHHCGYCGSFDGFGYTRTYFEIDHFVPKDFLIKSNSNIGLCTYSNLVYSCRFCNNFKTKHWPSGSDTSYILNEEGFVDPCTDEYNTHLYRTSEGAIHWNTNIGKWMATIAFKFDERAEELKLLWKLNETRKTIDNIIDELINIPDTDNDYIQLNTELSKLNHKHYCFQKELDTFYNG